jgi:peptide deformylase
MILKVAHMGHPVLRERAREVTPDELSSDGFQAFLDDLLETMVEYDGAGLAAPQVHVSLRAVVLALDDEPEFLINPRIRVLSDSVRRTWEGCLSVPRMRGLVERPDHIRLDFLDREGAEHVYELRGFPAVVVQHECDHLDGILYVDKVLPRSLSFLDEFHRYGPPGEYAEDETEELPIDIDLEPVEEETISDGPVEDETDRVET